MIKESGLSADIFKFSQNLKKNKSNLYQYIKQHKCEALLSEYNVASVEQYWNKETGSYEWFYITGGFYDAKKVCWCPHCKQMLSEHLNFKDSNINIMKYSNGGDLL